MLQTVWAEVHDGKIELLEQVSLPEGAKVLVTLLPDEDENQFWLNASELALARVWDNAEDDIYAQLLENEIVVVRYPFSDLSATKVRPAIVVHAPHPSQDSLIVPLTSRTTALLPGEFVLNDWIAEGLNVPTAVKRGIYTVHQSLILKLVGTLSLQDAQQLNNHCGSGWGYDSHLLKATQL